MSCVTRFVGAGGLDFHVHQRDKNIAIISADIIPQILSPIRRTLQPLRLTRIYRDLTGRIIVSFKNIPRIRSITLTQKGISYPLIPGLPPSSSLITSRTRDVIDQGECTDCRGSTSVALPPEIDSGIAELNVITDTEDYQAKIVIPGEDPCSFDYEVIPAGGGSYDIYVTGTDGQVAILTGDNIQGNVLIGVIKDGQAHIARVLINGTYSIELDGCEDSSQSFTIPL